MAHGILAALAAIDDSRARGLYNRLQEVYNSSRPPASLPAPPLEESQRVYGFCDDVHSRCVWGVDILQCHMHSGWSMTLAQRQGKLGLEIEVACRKF